eukprot:7324259-Prymnesium_polylepis.1
MVPSPWESVVLRRRVRLCSYELRVTSRASCPWHWVACMSETESRPRKPACEASFELLLATWRPGDRHWRLGDLPRTV